MEWQIVQTIVYLVTFLGTVCGFGIRLSNVIQRNTHAINSLNNKLNELNLDDIRMVKQIRKSVEDNN